MAFPYTDNFSSYGADTELAADAAWTASVKKGLGIMVRDVAGNKLVEGYDNATDQENVVVYTGQSINNDHYCQAVVKRANAAYKFGVAARMSNSALNGYTYQCDANDFRRIRRDGTIIKTSANTSFSASDLIKIEAEGTTIRGKINGGDTITVTDATYATGNAGMYFEGWNKSGRLDDFEAGNLGVVIIGLDVIVGSTAGGDTIVITGTGFEAAQGGGGVTFGGSAASINAWSDTEITCTTPAHASGAVDVVVTNNSTQTDTDSGGFTYNIPRIDVISPSLGAAAGGTPVTITGDYFGVARDDGTVTFDVSLAASYVSWATDSITVTTPAHAAGQVDVIVKNSNEDSKTETDGYEYIAVQPACSGCPMGTSIDIGILI